MITEKVDRPYIYIGAVTTWSSSDQWLNNIRQIIFVKSIFYNNGEAGPSKYLYKKLTTMYFAL